MGAILVVWLILRWRRYGKLWKEFLDFKASKAVLTLVFDLFFIYATYLNLVNTSFEEGVFYSRPQIAVPLVILSAIIIFSVYFFISVTFYIRNRVR